jgi:hypothetical protein
MDVIHSIFPIFQYSKLALKDAEDNSLQLFYKNICSKRNNKVTKRKEVSLIMLKLGESVAVQRSRVWYDVMDCDIHCKKEKNKIKCNTVHSCETLSGLFKDIVMK